MITIKKTTSTNKIKKHKKNVIKNNADIYFDDFEKESRKVMYKL